MKKLMILFAVLLLAGCDNKIVDIPEVTPAETSIEIPEQVALPDEASKFILYYNFNQEKFIEGTLYEPGTYVRFLSEPTGSDGYPFAVVVIDEYGHIAGAYLDETYSSNILFEDEEGTLYTLVDDSDIKSYRVVDLNTPYSEYPLSTSATKEGDLIVGKDDDIIDTLDEVFVNETKRYLNNTVSEYDGLSYSEQMKAIEQKIVTEQSIYGFELYKSGKNAKTSSIPGVTVDLKYHLQLIKDILEEDAVLKVDTELPDPAYHSMGRYYQGSYVAYSRRVKEQNQIYFGFSVAVINEYGRLAGLYVDETTPSTLFKDTFTTKYALDEYYDNVDSTETWKMQSERFASYVVEHQRLSNFNVYSKSALGKILEEEKDAIYSKRVYSDVIEEVTIRVDLIATATIDVLELARINPNQNNG